jgi:hypothetical protein
MLTRFNDRVFLQEGGWFVWDSSLGLFRPIDGFGWNGESYEVDDKAYRTDPLDKTFCFGSVETLAICVELTKKYESRVSTVPEAKFFAIGTPVWFRDRPVSFTPCAPQDLQSWKRLTKGNTRTCKRRSKIRFTKRNNKE